MRIKIIIKFIILLGMIFVLFANAADLSQEKMLRFDHSDLCLGYFSDHAAQIECSSDFNRTWELLSTGNDYYYIKATGENKCLDIERSRTDNGARVIPFACNGTTSQQFALIPLYDAYMLRARHSGKCIEVEKNSKEIGQRVIQFTCFGIRSQLLTIEDVR